jgi:DNA-binding transcriptional MerR regulator
MQGYSKKIVAESTGIIPRYIQFWTEEDLVIPEVDPGKGRGRVRRYSSKNLREFLLIQELSNYGLTLSSIKTITDEFRAHAESAAILTGQVPLDNKKYYLIVYTEPQVGDLRAELRIAEVKGTGTIAAITGEELAMWRSVVAIDLGSLFEKVKDY